jgi:RNA-directed DNA polymerase
MHRHPNTSTRGIIGQDWRVDDGQGWRFQPSKGGHALSGQAKTPMQYQVKVTGTRRPYDGDGRYWRPRWGRQPTSRPRVARLRTTQGGHCSACGLSFTDDETFAVDHVIPKTPGGRRRLDNLHLLHRHCHRRKTAHEQSRGGTSDKRHVVEEPDDAKASRPVVKPGRGGDTPA